MYYRLPDSPESESEIHFAKIFLETDGMSNIIFNALYIYMIFQHLYDFFARSIRESER